MFFASGNEMVGIEIHRNRKPTFLRLQFAPIFVNIAVSSVYILVYYPAGLLDFPIEVAAEGARRSEHGLFYPVAWCRVAKIKVMSYHTSYSFPHSGSIMTLIYGEV